MEDRKLLKGSLLIKRAGNVASGPINGQLCVAFPLDPWTIISSAAAAGSDSESVAATEVKEAGECAREDKAKCLLGG